MSEESFSEFELELSLRADWGPDSGVFIRTDESGGGWQIYFDHRDSGNVGHVRLETKDYSVPFRPFYFSRVEEGAPELGMTIDQRTEAWPEGVYEESCTPEEWLAAWRPGDWNVLRIRCSGGALPVIETWVNDLKVCRFDASKTTHPGFDPERAKEVAGASGAIGFQVHRGPGWPEGARVFRKDIRVRLLGGS